MHTVRGIAHGGESSPRLADCTHLRGAWKADLEHCRQGGARHSPPGVTNLGCPSDSWESDGKGRKSEREEQRGQVR